MCAVPYGEVVTLANDDIFTHMLVVGPTRCGKTSTILKPIIYKTMLYKKMGVPIGITIIEPKGDVAEMIREFGEEMGLPYIHVDPTRADSHRFNPMEGNIDDVAEATVIVLKGLFGKQDAFFATVQELSARNVTKLLKRLRGDDLDIVDVLKALREPTLLESLVNELSQQFGEADDLVAFFRNELLGTMKSDYAKYVIGLRAQLENIISNANLKRVMTGKSDIDIDEHFENGGILGINTALGLLGRSGDAFGQFAMMHMQSGTFRRKGTEQTRVPHLLIVDELSRYINPDLERFVSIAASYRVSGIFATQSLSQLAIETGNVSGENMKRIIMSNCRNKIAFAGLPFEDAQEFADEFGKERVIQRQSTYKNHIFLPNLIPESYRDTEVEEYRFSPTDIMTGLQRFNFIHQLMKEGHPQVPSLAIGSFIPYDWKELKEWEVKEEEETPKFKLKSPIQFIKELTFSELIRQKREKKNAEYNDRKKAEMAQRVIVAEKDGLLVEGLDNRMVNAEKVNKALGITDEKFTDDGLKVLISMIDDGTMDNKLLNTLQQEERTTVLKYLNQLQNGENVEQTNNECDSEIPLQSEPSVMSTPTRNLKPLNSLKSLNPNPVVGEHDVVHKDKAPTEVEAFTFDSDIVDNEEQQEDLLTVELNVDESVLVNPREEVERIATETLNQVLLKDTASSVETKENELSIPVVEPTVNQQPTKTSKPKEIIESDSKDDFFSFEIELDVEE